ncbi:MAG: AraC family ligand binding domain-containing protein [Desulfovibrio sp.]
MHSPIREKRAAPAPEPHARPEESARSWLPAELPGVELLRARFVRQNFARHFHRRYAVGVIEQGGMAFRYLGRDLVAPAGSVNLVVPGEPHDGHAAGGAGWTYRMFYLDPHWLGRAAEELSGRGCARLPHFNAGVLDDPLLAASIRALHAGLDTGTFSTLEAQTRLYALLTRWIAHHAESRTVRPGSCQEPEAVRRVRALLEERHAEDLGLDELARAAELSPFHLARVFCRSVGLPPHAYLTQVRVRRARELLAGPQSLADIAACVGFADQSHLTRHFKRIVGLPPGRWRKIVQDR